MRHLSRLPSPLVFHRQAENISSISDAWGDQRAPIRAAINTVSSESCAGLFLPSERNLSFGQLFNQA
jgi:hypothetical protein